MNDFRKIIINYNYLNDETSVNLSKKFLELPLVHQLDALKDAIGELTEIYNTRLLAISNNAKLFSCSQNTTVN
tara:strand:+ start:1424 stop:1642 length:219 start_codon:yes stop_codon:yes gene_type:complete